MGIALENNSAGVVETGAVAAEGTAEIKDGDQIRKGDWETLVKEAGSSARRRWADLSDEDVDTEPPEATEAATRASDSAYQEWADDGEPWEGLPWSPVEHSKHAYSQGKTRRWKGNGEGHAYSNSDSNSNTHQWWQGEETCAAASQWSSNSGQWPPQRHWKAKGSASNDSTGWHPRGVKKQAAWSDCAAAWAESSGSWWEPASEAYSTAHLHRVSSGGKKLQCQFIIGIEEEPEFRVGRKLLGPSGQHMKRIAERTGARLRLRGRGSRFLEGPNQEESPDPLMLCISAQGQKAYEMTLDMVKRLLENVYSEYQDFCMKAGTEVPTLRLQCHEGAREGSR